MNDVQLLALIRAIYAEFKGAYGWPRMVREIRGYGIPASNERVRLLMKKYGIKARHKRKFKATCISNHDLPVSPNRLEQNFATQRCDQVWTADINYIPTSEG